MPAGPTGVRDPVTAASAIELSGLRKSFGSRRPVPAVAGIDLTIRPGEIVALLGPNGAGKTTTLDLILGFTRPTAGTCRVFGAAPDKAVRTGRVGGVLQSGALLSDLSVRETVAMIATQFPRAISVSDALSRAGATEFAHRKVSRCSGGEQQRLRFALALLSDPELLILDEPTAGMDVSARRDFWSAMGAEAAQGRTIVFATHYLAEAEEFAQRTVVMRRGRIVADGTTDQVRALGGTRTLSCVWNPGDGDPAAVPGVASVTPDRGRIVFHPDSGGADALARVLLTTTAASDLLIEPARLEEAFIGLTEDGPEGHSA